MSIQEEIEKFNENADRIKSYEPIGGRWRIDDLIGSGGFGSVYKISDYNNIYDCEALKIISIHKGSWINPVNVAGHDLRETVKIAGSTNQKFEDVVQSIRNEILLSEEVSECKYFVRTYEHYEYYWDSKQGIDFMIRMELLTPVITYFSMMGFSEKKLLELAIDMCEGLVYLESRGIIHNDIKPENIYYSEDEDVYKLGDLGAADRLGSSLMEGTVLYCAPERARYGQKNAQTDIYSLGITLYILAGGDRRDVILNSTGIGLSKPRDVSMEFANIILKACNYDANERIENAQEMLEQLRKLKGISKKKEKIPKKFNKEKKKRGIIISGNTKKKIYKIVNWLLFTCCLAMMPMVIFLLFRSCFKPDFPYVNKCITEVLYFGLTLSITTIKDLVSSDLWKKEKVIFVIELFLSLSTLILDAIFFGMMTANDMSLLVANTLNKAFLLRMAIGIAGVSFIEGIGVQWMGVNE